MPQGDSKNSFSSNAKSDMILRCGTEPQPGERQSKDCRALSAMTDPSSVGQVMIEDKDFPFVGSRADLPGVLRECLEIDKTAERHGKIEIAANTLYCPVPAWGGAAPRPSKILPTSHITA
jgi:hypothetical protein